MKLLTIVIPSYNSEKFILDCLNSLLIGEDEKLDVIVINDGSKDATSELAHGFAKEHPFVRVVDKENGGHGSGINKGIELAEGLYLKVLDSDDFLEKEGLVHLLRTIERHIKEEHLPDLYLADYHSCPQGTDIKTPVSIKHRVKKVEEFITFNDIKGFKSTEFLMIHMTFVKTSFLRDTKMHLLEKTFYEDNQFVFHLVKYVDSIYYLEKSIYLYSVGRDGQSISLTSADKNYPHQFRVIRACVDDLTYEEYKAMDKGRQYNIRHELFIISVVTYFYTYIIPRKEKKKMYSDFIKYFRKSNPKIFRVVRFKSPAFWLWFCPPFLRGFATKIGYKKVGRKEGWK